MPYCPDCQAEFREGFTRCNSCDVDLVETLPEPFDLSEENIKQALAGKDLIPVTRATLDVVKETRDLLSAHRVASLILDDENEKTPPGYPKRVILVVGSDDLEAAGKVLGESFHQMLDEEGIDPQQSQMVSDKCPACSAEIKEDQEECADCGLFIPKL